MAARTATPTSSPQGATSSERLRSAFPSAETRRTSASTSTGPLLPRVLETSESTGGMRRREKNMRHLSLVPRAARREGADGESDAQPDHRSRPMKYPVHTLDSAPVNARDTLGRIVEAWGFLPHLGAVMAES